MMRPPHRQRKRTSHSQIKKKLNFPCMDQMTEDEDTSPQKRNRRTSPKKMHVHALAASVKFLRGCRAFCFADPPRTTTSPEANKRVVSNAGPFNLLAVSKASTEDGPTRRNTNQLSMNRGIGKATERKAPH